MSIYTRSGDNGRSSTKTRTSLPKNSPVFELLGTVDELTSSLGAAKLKTSDGLSEIIEAIQKNLNDLAGEIAGGKKFADSVQIKKLESSIDSISAALPEYGDFIIPGASEGGALLDVSRTVARRAERMAVACQQRGGITKELLAWLNRLSDLLYCMARLSDMKMPKHNTVSVTPASGSLDGFCDMAEKLCKAVRTYASQNGVKIVVAVCDAGGNLVGFQREDDAYIASIDIAVNKAYTSAALKMPTSLVGELAKPGGSLYGIQNTNNGRIVIFGGGEPLMKDGVVVGAIGVSGGTAEQDTAIGEYGAEYFKKEML